MCPAGTLKGEPVLKILDSEISKALTPNSILHILEFFFWGAQGGGAQLDDKIDRLRPTDKFGETYSGNFKSICSLAGVL